MPFGKRVRKNIARILRIVIDSKKTAQAGPPQSALHLFEYSSRITSFLFFHLLVSRPPVFGGKVKKLDASEALKVAGVKAVEQVPSGVAVIAERFWSAKLGREKLVIEWDLGPNAELSTANMLREFAETAQKPGAIAIIPRR